MKTAFVRRPDRSITRCELSFIGRDPIDFNALRAAHTVYVDTLKQAGFSVVLLPDAVEAPDGMFVEDTAVILGSCAVICRPGAVARQNEVDSVEAELDKTHEIFKIDSTGTIDGGDVLVAGKKIFVGIGFRTDMSGFVQFQTIAHRLGYVVTAVDVGDCLHLKTAVTLLADETLLLNRQWVDAGVFCGFKLLDIDQSEPFSANIIGTDLGVICSAQFVRTNDSLNAAGYHLLPVDSTEAAKAEAGLTCCSLLTP